MIITCQKCNTSFRLDESLLSPEGSKVRCSRCKHIFTAYRPAETVEAEPAEPAAETAETGEKLQEEASGIDLAELDAIFGGELAEEGPGEEPGEGGAVAEEEEAGRTSRLEELDGEDLDLDFDMDLEPEGAAIEEDTAQIDDLDLDMDFDLEDEDLADIKADNGGEADVALEGAEDTGAGEGVVEEPDLGGELDIKDELELELADVDAKAGGEEIEASEPELSLDLESEEKELELDLEPDVTSSDSEEQELVLEPDLKEEDLSLEIETGEKDDLEAAEAELDFSDLQNVFEDDTQQDQLNLEVDKAGGQEDQEPELELELESDQGEAPSDEDLEDLEFQLDSEFDEKALEDAGNQEGQEAEEELDLTDIEQMLEEQPHAAAAGDEGRESETAPDDLVIQDELDLEELEQAIEEADQEGEGDKGEDQELELDFPDLDRLPDGEEELKLDISEIEQPVENDVSSSSMTMDTGDIELQFEIEDEQPADEEERPVPKDLEKITQTVQMDEKESADEIEQAGQEPVTPPAKPARRPAKKGVSKTLIFLLVIVVLGGIGYGLYYAVTQMGIQIPYLSDYLKPQPQDPYGTLHLSTFDITSKFMENQNDGRLFVITGKVRNGYDHPRGMIRVRGNLFSSGKKLVKTEYAYCGVILPDSELVQKPFVEIKRLLNQRPAGDLPANWLQPGQAAKFMVVFSKLPQDLEEFTIELVGSSPVGK